MLLEIRMFDEFYEIEIIRCNREVSRIPELNENIMVLKDVIHNIFFSFLATPQPMEFPG